MQNKQTWQIVMDFVDQLKEQLGLNELPIKEIIVHFGYWQSQPAFDDGPPEKAHAHINLVLSKKAVAAASG